MDEEQMDEEEMDKEADAESPESRFIYPNWRGKSFVLDEAFAKTFRESLVGYDPEQDIELLPEDVAYLTPKKIMDELPFYEEIERLKQLEEMWEMHGAKTDR